jgi:hypothetical protein
VNGSFVALSKNLVWLVIALLISQYGCVVAVHITDMKMAGTWTVISGSITVDSSKVPKELRYNTDENGFLAYWEKYLPRKVAEHSKIQIDKVRLWWVGINDSRGYDTIGFYVKLRLKLW